VSRAEKIKHSKAEGSRLQNRAVAKSLATAFTSLLDSREALSTLGHHRSAERLTALISYVSTTRRLLHDQYASTVGEAEADKLFPEIPRFGTTAGHRIDFSNK
jgi:hypothetical protein